MNNNASLTGERERLLKFNELPGDVIEASSIKHATSFCSTYPTYCIAIMISIIKNNDYFNDHWEDQDVGGWTILKWILER
jgi:hypothetical protein